MRNKCDESILELASKKMIAIEIVLCQIGVLQGRERTTSELESCAIVRLCYHRPHRRTGTTDIWT